MSEEHNKYIWNIVNASLSVFFQIEGKLRYMKPNDWVYQ